MSAPRAANTKAGRLDAWEARLNAVNLVVPPRRVITPPFGPQEAEVVRALERFKALATSEGPFLPYVIVRNNGAPEGTGEGKSIPIKLDASPKQVIDLMERVQHSDTHAKGVLLMPFVGQRIMDDDRVYREVFAPLFGGIAYTAPCTERGNAVIEWAYGHPAKVMRGGGHYAAFNAENLEQQANVDLFGKTREPHALNRFFDYGLKIDRVFKGGDFIDDTARGGRHFLKNIFEAVLALGEHGKVYLEWGLTAIGSQMQAFAFQASEFSGTLSGIPTWMHTALRDFRKLVIESGEDVSDLDALKARYEQAVADPRVVAAGFDLVGKERREFDTLLWHFDTDELYTCEEKKALLALSTHSRTNMLALYHGVQPVEETVGGVVELLSGRKQDTFKAHMHGFCSSRGILGLGGVERMDHKLYALLPPGKKYYENEPLVLKGKFVLEVDETIPFGTMRVERIDSFKRVGRN